MSKYLAGAAVILLGVVILLFQSNSAAGPAAEVGKPAPSFALKDVDGKEYTLSDFLSKRFTVIMFIATQCPISNDYNERMAALYNDYASKDIAFVGINSNKQEDIEEIKDHAAKNGFKFDSTNVSGGFCVTKAFEAVIAERLEFITVQEGEASWLQRLSRPRRSAHESTNPTR